MEIQINDYGMNGEGVGSINGKIVLINNALKNEVIQIEIEKDFGNYAIGAQKRIVSKSSARAVPFCPYFFECGGCQLQHMSYNEQQNFKQLLVKKTLKKITGFDFDVNKLVISSEQKNYRNKMSFSIRDQQIGLFKESSNDLVKVRQCALAKPNINKIVTIFKEFLASFHDHKHLKNLVVRDINDQILVGVVSNKQLNLNPLLKMLSNNFEKIGLYQIINTRKDSVVLSGKTIHIGGLKEIEINNQNLTYFVDLLGFHQTNIEIQNKIYETVLKYLSPNSIVVNGFSGQGLLSGILAQKAQHVYGIEINKSSHKSAENLKNENAINNLTNILGDFHKEIKKLKADTLVLDPTKKGCSKNIMHEIKGFKNIIYISCNPIALAKDLNYIKNDYEVEEITPFDMFPNTVNVETVVKLKLKEIN